LISEFCDRSGMSQERLDYSHLVGRSLAEEEKKNKQNKQKIIFETKYKKRRIKLFFSKKGISLVP